MFPAGSGDSGNSEPVNPRRAVRAGATSGPATTSSESPPTIKLMFVSHHNDVVFTLSLLCPTTPYLIGCNLTQRAVTSCSPDDLYLFQPSVMASRVQYSGTDERQKS